MVKGKRCVEEKQLVQTASYINHSSVGFIYFSTEVEHLVCADTMWDIEDELGEEESESVAHVPEGETGAKQLQQNVI